MRKTFLWLALMITIGFLLVFPNASYAINLIPNPGFESGSGTNAYSWTENTFFRANSTVYSGSWAMSMPSGYTVGSGIPGRAAITSSSINVEVGKAYLLSGWIYNGIIGGGSAYIDANDIANDPTLLSTPGSNQWEYISKVFYPNTSSIRIRLVVDGSQGSINQGSTAYFDDLSLGLIPEPASMALLGMGLLGAIGVGFRRKKI